MGAELSGTGESAAGAKRLVRHGWNAVSYRYRPEEEGPDAFGHTLAEHARWLRPVLEQVSARSRILDLGCGCGVPDARLLASRCRVTGVDLSLTQLERARRAVPAAEFVLADMTRVQFRPASFEAIVSLYSILHVPVAEQPSLLERMADWLVPGGLLLLIAGHDAWTGTQERWLGSDAPMFWSHADGDTYARWLGEAGLAVLRREVVPEGASAHELFECRAPD